jgi:hypothetical protein
MKNIDKMGILECQASSEERAAVVLLNDVMCRPLCLGMFITNIVHPWSDFCAVPVDDDCVEVSQRSDILGGVVLTTRSLKDPEGHKYQYLETFEGRNWARLHGSETLYYVTSVTTADGLARLTAFRVMSADRAPIDLAYESTFFAPP